MDLSRVLQQRSFRAAFWEIRFRKQSLIVRVEQICGENERSQGDIHKDIVKIDIIYMIYVRGRINGRIEQTDKMYQMPGSCSKIE